MHINEIVFTRSLLDAGLCVGSENGVPVILGSQSNNQYLEACYGDVQLVDWVASGKYCTKEEWLRRTSQSMRPTQIMNAFGITANDLHATACMIEPSIDQPLNTAQVSDIDKTIAHFESLQKRYTRQHNGKMCERVQDALTALYYYKKAFK